MTRASTDPGHVNNNCLEGIACPQCGQTDEVYVRAMVTISVVDNGTDFAEDAYDGTDYDSTSPAYCPVQECGFEGTWADFEGKWKEES